MNFYSFKVCKEEGPLQWGAGLHREHRGLFTHQFNNKSKALERDGRERGRETERVMKEREGGRSWLDIRFFHFIFNYRILLKSLNMRS